jgi:starch synthase
MAGSTSTAPSQSMLSASGFAETHRSGELRSFSSEASGDHLLQFPTVEKDKVLFVTSEISDFVKCGGLGDVSSALPRALQAGVDVRCVVPGYRQVIDGCGQIPVVAHLPGVAGVPSCDLGRVRLPDGLTLYVILCPELYEREGSPYGDARGIDWADNDVRFARLALAAADMASGRGDPEWCPQLLHLNDWTSGLAPAYLAWRGHDMPTIFSIHNLAYQGLFERRRLPLLAIPDSAFDIDGVEFYGKLSFLKAGIFYASHVTTVSPTYAREITTVEHGCGLEGLLRSRSSSGCLTGILNGIGPGWDARTDPALVGHFEPADWRGKRANAAHVRELFGLQHSTGPLFAMVSRLVHQKGIDLAIAAAETIVGGGGQVVFTGQGEAQIADALRRLQSRHPDAIGVRIGFDEAEARQTFAGSDFLLMPSRFEPCGLSQMYAQRFASLPIAHRTGGLADTIEDGATGFLFDAPSHESLCAALLRAFVTFSCPQQLQAMRTAAMSRPHGWETSALNYRSLYRHSLGRSGPWKALEAAYEPRVTLLSGMKVTQSEPADATPVAAYG